MAANPNTMAKVLRFVQVSSALTKRALDEVAQKRTNDKQASALVPDLLKRMQSAGTIAEHQTKSAEQLLNTHQGTLQLLKNAVDKIAELSKAAEQHKEAGDLGHGTDDKVGEDGGDADPNASLSSPFVGQRSSVKKASDVALFRGLGLSA